MGQALSGARTQGHVEAGLEEPSATWEMDPTLAACKADAFLPVVIFPAQALFFTCDLNAMYTGDFFISEPPFATKKQ